MLERARKMLFKLADVCAKCNAAVTVFCTSLHRPPLLDVLAVNFTVTHRG